MKNEAAELTAALLEGAFEMRPDLKRALEVVLRDYELLWNVYIAANVVRDTVSLGGAGEGLRQAVEARNRG